MFQIPTKVIGNLSYYFMKNSNTIVINASRSTNIFLFCQYRYLPGYRSLSSQKVFNQYKSFVSRKHVTSSRYSAEATLATPVAYDRNTQDDSKLTKIKKPTLPSNIVIRYCPTTIKADNSNGFIYESNYQSIIDTNSPRPLVLLLAWMLAKEKHIEKYREFWFQRGYDVLSVRTSPLALLLPNIGGRKNACHIYNFISNHRPFYDEILVHAFSVGGYQLGELLSVLEQKTPSGNPLAEKVYNSLKGFIIDSCVFPEDAATGLSRAVTKYTLLQRMLEKSIENFLKLTKSFTMDRYKQVQNILLDNKKKVPGLMLYSKDDLVSSLAHNQKMHEDWKANGTMADFLCWDQSSHVLHYKEHQSEYQQKVDEFLSKLKITKAKQI